MGNTTNKKLPGTWTGHKYDRQRRVRIGDVVTYKKQLYVIVASQGYCDVDLALLTAELLAGHFPPTSTHQDVSVCDCTLVSPCLTKMLWNNRHTELCNNLDKLTKS